MRDGGLWHDDFEVAVWDAVSESRKGYHVAVRFHTAPDRGHCADEFAVDLPFLGTSPSRPVTR